MLKLNHVYLYCAASSGNECCMKQLLINYTFMDHGNAAWDIYGPIIKIGSNRLPQQIIKKNAFIFKLFSSFIYQ